MDHKQYGFLGSRDTARAANSSDKSMYFGRESHARGGFVVNFCSGLANIRAAEVSKAVFSEEMRVACACCANALSMSETKAVAYSHPRARFQKRSSTLFDLARCKTSSEKAGSIVAENSALFRSM